MGQKAGMAFYHSKVPSLSANEMEMWRNTCFLSQSNHLLHPLPLSNDQQSVISDGALCNHRLSPEDDCSPLPLERDKAWRN